MKNLKLMVIFTLLALTAPLFAQEKIVIDMNDRAFRGQTDLNLKQLARRYSGMNLNRAKLKNVRLVAKSRQGRGQVTLDVAGNRSYTMRVDGYPADFQSNRPFTYNRINLDVFGQSRGNWMLYLRGNIKIKKIVLFVEEQMGPRNNRVRLDFFGEQFRGENTIRLKQELRRERPNLRLRNFNVKKVILNAKSKQGRGRGTLLVGGDRSLPQMIGGYPANFQSNRPNTFQRVVINNRAYGDSEGVWQVQLKGNIKVDSIIVVLERKNNHW